MFSRLPIRSGHFAGKLGQTKIITAPIRLGEGKSLIVKSFIALGKELKVPASQARDAVEEALAAQAGFEDILRYKGKEILSRIGPDQKVFVLISRPYNGCDDGMNLQLPKKLAELGAQIIPMDMLDLSSAQLTDPSLHESVYWSYGQRILRAAEIVRRDPRLFGIYLSNFSCGPDSFISTFFKDIMGQKPCLQLEIDEHSADAGVAYPAGSVPREPEELSPRLAGAGRCNKSAASSLPAHQRQDIVYPVYGRFRLRSGCVL